MLNMNSAEEPVDVEKQLKSFHFRFHFRFPFFGTEQVWKLKKRARISLH